MPADLLANVDGLTAVFGFWRFLFSASYRATVRARWQERTGLARLLTALEVLGATFLGLILPLLMLYVLLLTWNR